MSALPRSAARVRLAHLSDPHLSTLDGVRPRELLNKRLLGYLSWRWRRRREHRAEVLELLGADLAAAAPDHVVISGDLTHVGTPAECRQAATWLRRIGPPERVSLVPGNHDCYSSADPADTIGLWQDYMYGAQATAAFPWLRRLGPLAIIGLNSALPTAPLLATGTLGAEQLARLGELLAGCGAEQLCRIVLLHHPPSDAVSGWRRRLTDSMALRRVLSRHGAELVLHGHAHRRVRSDIDGGAGRLVPALGIPSASALVPRPERRAGYNLIDVGRGAGGDWEFQISSRRLDAAAAAFDSAAVEIIRVRAMH